MKISELKKIILNELFKNKTFKKLFVRMVIERYDEGSTICFNVTFDDDLDDDYFDENGEYDWDASSKAAGALYDYTVNVIKKIVPNKVKILKYDNWESDGLDIYVYFTDTTVSDDDWT